MESTNTEKEEYVECPKCGRRHRDDPPRLVQIAELHMRALDPNIDDGAMRTLIASQGTFVSFFMEVDVREQLGIHDDSEAIVQLQELAVWAHTTAQVEAIKMQQDRTIEERRDLLVSMRLDPTNVDLADPEAVQNYVTKMMIRRQEDGIDSLKNDD